MVRTRLATFAALLLLAGCGGGDGAPRAAHGTPSPEPTAAAAKANGPIGKDRPAPELVFFQRQGAGGATLDTFTVRRDGTARLEKRYGGAGGRFKDLELRRGVLPRLKAALARLPRSGTLERGTPDPGGAIYLMRYRGGTLTGRQGAISPRARPAVELLDGFIDGSGVKRATRETSTNNP